jgi:hypothetical protein
LEPVTSVYENGILPLAAFNRNIAWRASVDRNAREGSRTGFRVQPNAGQSIINGDFVLRGTGSTRWLLFLFRHSLTLGIAIFSNIRLSFSGAKRTK